MTTIAAAELRERKVRVYVVLWVCSSLEQHAMHKFTHYARLFPN